MNHLFLNNLRLAKPPLAKLPLSTLGLLLSVVLHVPAADNAKTAYNPLAVPAANSVTVKDLSVKDEKRKREIPLKAYLPPNTQSAPVILFSHGLGGSREGSAFLGKHWGARGYACFFLQHPGSDESVWKDVPLLQRMKAMREAAGVQNFMLRVQDVPAVLDQLEQWNNTSDHFLAGRLNLKQVGMSGHSFGAVTTQAVSGQQSARGKISFTDPRLTAALPMSPSLPKNADAEQSFGKVSIPWMLMTGTNDVAIIGDATVESRLAVFPALPAGGKYELVLHQAEHSAFTERALPGDKVQRNPNHHRVILALSTAFWDAYLRDDVAAKQWLNGSGPTEVLEPEDRWQKK